MFQFLFTKTPLKFYIQSIWRDEAFSYLLAKQNWFQILATTAKDSNPPLYYLLLNVWMLVFGHSEIALRTLSFFFFIATLYIVGLFLIEIMKVPVKQALLFLLLFVMNPLLDYYAFEARMYAMFAFMSVLSFYFLFKGDYKKYLIAALAGLYTHYFMFFVVAAQFAYLLYTDTRASWRKHLDMYTKMAVLYLPWALFVFFSKPPVNQGFWVPKPDLKTLLNIPAILLTGFETEPWYVYKSLPLITLALVLVIALFVYKTFLSRRKGTAHSVHASSRRRHTPFTLLLFWTVIPLVMILAVSVFKPLLLPRYMIFLSVGFMLLIVYMLRSFKPGLMYLLFAVLIFFSWRYGLFQAKYRNKQDLKTPLTEIKKIMGKNDLVYVTSEFNFHPAEYYVNDRQVYLFGKPYSSIPWFVGKVLIPESKLTNSLPVYPRKAFILDDSGHYTIQALF